MHSKLLKYTCAALLLVMGALSAAADSVYLAPEKFISDAFAGDPPAPEVLWVKTEQREELRRTLDQKLNALRLRYWRKGKRSAWILDEIGKDKPITTGVIVNDGRIEHVQVLVFRESRGWEVRHPFFTDQFVGAQALKDNQLNRDIDGITGATLSVRALERQARLALFLARYIPATPGNSAK